jgi:predicted RNase H-like HicB family nuclease
LKVPKLVTPHELSRRLLKIMKTTFTYWKEADGKYLGHLNSHPDHWTQGEDLEDLKEHLRDLYETFSTEDIPGIKKVEEFEVA